MKKFDVKEFSEYMGLPEVIYLSTSEVQLKLVGYCMDEINYAIDAKYLFHIKGDTDDIMMVDFAGGRTIIPGDVISGLTVLGIHKSHKDGEYLVAFENPYMERFEKYRNDRING